MRTLLFLFCNLTVLFSFGQTDDLIASSFLKDEKPEAVKPDEIKLNYNTSAFKFAPLNLILGEINFSFEQKVSKHGSIEFELGPTLSGVSLTEESKNFDKSGPNTRRTGDLGFLASFAYRIYPLDETEAMNRFYLSPMLKYKLYNVKEEDVTSFLPDERGKNARFNFIFNFGYEMWGSESLCIDFYAGLGVGYKEILQHTVSTVYSGQEWVNAWESDFSSGAQLVFNIGVKFGIGWKNF